MSNASDAHTIRTEEQLAGILGTPNLASIRKETPLIIPEYRAMIEASPMVVLATNGPDGLDATPRGDPAGFVTVENERTLLMPERRGNHRADSLHNIVADPRIALLFLIPGVNEMLRVNGRARISIDPSLLERFRMQNQLPTCVLVVHVETAYFQCGRAVLRSGLWNTPPADIRAKVPTAGAILESLTQREIEAARYDRELPERQRATLY